MDDFAVCGEALKDDIVPAPQLDHHVTRLPVHVPGLNGAHLRQDRVFTWRKMLSYTFKQNSGLRIRPFKNETAPGE